MQVCNKYLVVIFLAHVSLLNCYAQDLNKNKDDYSRVEKFIPKGNKVVFMKTADIDGNGLSDILLITENPDEQYESRTFQILQKEANEKIIVHKNRKLIPCLKCGGPAEEPTFRSLTTNKNTFSVSMFTGSPSDGCSYVVEFKYSNRYKTWLLTKTRTGYLDKLKGNGYRVRIHKYPHSLKRTLFEKANVDNLPY